MLIRLNLCVAARWQATHDVPYVKCGYRTESDKPDDEEG